MGPYYQLDGAALSRCDCPSADCEVIAALPPLEAEWTRTLATAPGAGCRDGPGVVIIDLASLHVTTPSGSRFAAMCMNEPPFLLPLLAVPAPTPAISG